MPGCTDATLCPIKGDLFDGIIDTVWNKVLDGVATLSDFVFIGELWAGVAVLIIVTGVIAIYVPWQWFRGALGYAVSIAIAVAVGAQLMFNRMRREKTEHEKRQEFDNAVKRSNDNTKSWW